MKKKRKLKWPNIFLIIITICCVIGLIISSYNIIKWKLDSKKIKDQVLKIKDDVTIEEVDGNIIEQTHNIDKDNPYWDYLKMNLINVDLKSLKSKNNQVKGWIQVSGTTINYPFVQTDNNDYYLTHSFDKKYNEAGWIFLDYRNNFKNLDKNTIIYGHGRLDKIMFGSLKNILSSGWLKNENNYVIKLSTETENTLWQVFSVYHIPTTSDYLQINFADNSEFLDFTKMLIDRSSFNFNTNINENDKILTLSTCYNENDKVVLHAKLIKFAKK